jgi:hypothetical protein
MLQVDDTTGGQCGRGPARPGLEHERRPDWQAPSSTWLRIGALATSVDAQLTIDAKDEDGAQR